jgi:hypothetical protein
VQFVIVQEMMWTAMESEATLALTSAPTQFEYNWSRMRTCSNVTVPPVTWIMLLSALVKSISTWNSLNSPSFVTQLKQYGIPLPSCSLPPSIANDFEPVTLIIDVYCNL